MLTAEELAGIPPFVPRILAQDLGDHWGWTNAAGWKATRDKETTPSLPAVLTEVHHGRGSPDLVRTIVLMPPN